jgi:hypothetical protein
MNLLYQAVLSSASFLDLLYALALDLAGKVQAKRCPICGGALHWASYWRKPRGVLAAMDAEFRKRFSFCCAARDCRKRLTPPSLRFLGRKVYLAAAVILLVVAAPQGAASADRRTLKRWRTWWRSIFTATPFWRAKKASFMPPTDEASLPAVLLERFAGDAKEKVLALLKFLRPITGGASAARAF